MRILFLDVDGVLNNITSLTNGNKHCPECITCLNQITRQSGAKIVVSSSRRGNPKLSEIFKYWGIEEEIYGITPSLEQRLDSSGLFVSVERGHEIQKWLDRTSLKIESFVILDDDKDMAHLIDRLVQTDFRTGLAPKHVEMALKVLSVPYKRTRKA